EADRIIAAAHANLRVVCVDMHKRFDPDHLRIHHDIKHRIGEPLYGRAILEEPLEVSTSIFKWAEQSDPFSYVGPHWTDLFHHYYNAKPVGLTAVGQKKRLVRDGINAYDAVQVRVDWDNGMSIYFQNNWINPPDFEGPVNQEHEIVGTDGKVESDQQYRGFRFWTAGGGSRTSNNHFTREVPRADGTAAYIGYGTDSIYVGLVAACRIKYLGATLDEVKPLFPTPEAGAAGRDAVPTDPDADPASGLGADAGEAVPVRADLDAGAAADRLGTGGRGAGLGPVREHVAGLELRGAGHQRGARHRADPR